MWSQDILKHESQTGSIYRENSIDFVEEWVMTRNNAPGEGRVPILGSHNVATSIEKINSFRPYIDTVKPWKFQDSYDVSSSSGDDESNKLKPFKINSKKYPWFDKMTRKLQGNKCLRPLPESRIKTFKSEITDTEEGEGEQFIDNGECEVVEFNELSKISSPWDRIVEEELEDDKISECWESQLNISTRVFSEDKEESSINPLDECNCNSIDINITQRKKYPEYLRHNFTYYENRYFFLKSLTRTTETDITLNLIGRIDNLVCARHDLLDPIISMSTTLITSSEVYTVNNLVTEDSENIMSSAASSQRFLGDGVDFVSMVTHTCIKIRNPRLNHDDSVIVSLNAFTKPIQPYNDIIQQPEKPIVRIFTVKVNIEYPGRIVFRKKISNICKYLPMILDPSRYNYFVDLSENGFHMSRDTNEVYKKRNIYNCNQCPMLEYCLNVYLASAIYKDLSRRKNNTEDDVNLEMKSEAHSLTRISSGNNSLNADINGVAGCVEPKRIHQRIGDEFPLIRSPFVEILTIPFPSTNIPLFIETIDDVPKATYYPTQASRYNTRRVVNSAVTDHRTHRDDTTRAYSRDYRVEDASPSQLLVEPVAHRCTPENHPEAVTQPLTEPVASVKSFLDRYKERGDSAGERSCGGDTLTEAEEYAKTLFPFSPQWDGPTKVIKRPEQRCAGPPSPTDSDVEFEINKDFLKVVPLDDDDGDEDRKPVDGLLDDEDYTPLAYRYPRKPKCKPRVKTANINIALPDKIIKEVR